MQVLGVSAQATSKQVEAAYRQRRRAAEMKSDKEALKRIESAHSSLFMKSLSSRLSVRCLLQFEPSFLLACSRHASATRRTYRSGASCGVPRRELKSVTVCDMHCDVCASLCSAARSRRTPTVQLVSLFRRGHHAYVGVRAGRQEDQERGQGRHAAMAAKGGQGSAADPEVLDRRLCDAGGVAVCLAGQRRRRQRRLVRCRLTGAPDL